MNSLIERRNEASEKLDALRRERGIAVLDGKEFDGSAIVTAESEIDALDAAEAEATRRDRDAWVKAEAERRRWLRANLEKVAEQRLTAIDRCESAARDLAVALKELMVLSADASALIRALGLNPPLELTENAVALRASLRVSAALKPLTGRRKFGAISLPESQGPHLQDGTNITDSWKVAEAKKVAPAITNALKGPTT